MEVSKNYNSRDLYIIKDASGALGTLILGIFVLIVAAILVLIMIGVGSTIGAFAIGGGLGLFGVALIQKFRVMNQGYRIDFVNDIFTYPGGKAADSVGEILSLKYQLQRFGLTIQQIRISEIQRVSYDNERKWNKNTKRHEYEYKITFEGPFGSITNSFGDEGKRDQLMTIMVQNLQMGDPVVFR